MLRKMRYMQKTKRSWHAVFHTSQQARQMEFQKDWYIFPETQSEYQFERRIILSQETPISEMDHNTVDFLRIRRAKNGRASVYAYNITFTVFPISARYTSANQTDIHHIQGLESHFHQR